MNGMPFLGKALKVSFASAPATKKVPIVCYPKELTMVCRMNSQAHPPQTLLLGQHSPLASLGILNKTFMECHHRHPQITMHTHIIMVNSFYSINILDSYP